MNVISSRPIFRTPSVAVYVRKSFTVGIPLCFIGPPVIFVLHLVCIALQGVRCEEHGSKAATYPRHLAGRSESESQEGCRDEAHRGGKKFAGEHKNF